MDILSTPNVHLHIIGRLYAAMAAEIMAFLATDNRWFCHFDDDNYVNVPALVKKLSHFDHNSEWYLGKPSISSPLQVTTKSDKKKVTFWFATGGAGFCLSRPLAQRMAPLVENGGFVATGENIRLPDDVTVGYIIEHELGAFDGGTKFPFSFGAFEVDLGIQHECSNIIWICSS